MTWLFPLYLLGGAAVIGPILMHLRRKPPQDRVEFSSLMFLDSQTPVPVSKRRLENWLLLLLRCLALILLALMFARPIWQGADKNADLKQTATLVLLDRSASMRRGDLWKQAAERAMKQVQAAKGDDRVALAVFDREVRMLWSFDEDVKDAGSRIVTARQRLEQAPAGWGATDLGRALVESAATFSGSLSTTGLKRRIVLVSDLQEGARLDALRGMVWPENVTLVIERVDAPNVDNFSIALAAAVEVDPKAPVRNETPAEPGTTPAPEAVRVRLSNARDSKAADFTLAWEKSGTMPVTGYLPPGASRVLSVPGVGGTALVLIGDAWDFDNKVFTAPPQPRPVRIAFIGAEDSRNEAAAPLYYLSRAIQTTATLTPLLTVLAPEAAAVPKETNIVFIGGTSAAMSAGLTTSLRDWMQAGGMVVQVVESPGAQKSVRELSGVADLKIEEGVEPADGYLMLAEVDSGHPLLLPFADSRLRDFTKLRFWKHRRITLPAAKAGADAKEAAKLAVIARFDNGAPAMLAGSQGKGTLLVLASGWHPADSQLALSTKFVPLLYGWLDAAGFRNELAASLLVGDVLPAEGETTVMTPDGKTLKTKAGETLRAEMPGIYKIQDPRQKTELKYAVNLPPDEGRVTPLEPERLREFGVRLDAASLGATVQDRAEAAEIQEKLAITEQEGRQRAWLWLLGGLLGVLGLETWLAGRAGGKSGELLQPGALSS